MFGSPVTSARCGKRPSVRVRGDFDANHAGIFTVMAGNPRRQASAGSKHGDIAREHVADEFLNARPSCRGGQVLDEQCADTLALPCVVNQNRELSLIGAKHLV